MANDSALQVPDESHPRRWAILWIMCVALILVVAGVSSLNVAIPSIINDLQPSSTETLWIVDSYALVFAGLLLPAGAIGDRYGRKGALLTGLVILSAGAVWASTANTPMTLISARSLMGVGAAFVMPATLSIIVSVFGSEERSKAIAIWTGFAGAGGAIGIVGGGALLEAYWWGSVFFINIPIAAATLALVAFLVPTSRDADQQSLDLIGSVLSIAGLGALVYAIIEGGDAGWAHSTTLVAFGAAVTLLTAFVLFELRTPHPMLDPRLFRHLPFGLSALTITIAFAVMFGMFFITTQFFQFAQGHSPLEAGLRSLPFALSMILVAPRSPALVEKIGPRASVVLGFAIQAVGFAILAVIEADTPYAITVVGIVCMATGLSVLMPVASEAIVSSLPPNKAGVGSAVNDTTREVGGALGLAAMGSLLASSYRSEIEPLTTELPPEAAELAQSSIGGALQVASQTNNSALVEASQQAFVDGMSMSFGIAAGIGAAAAMLMAFTYPNSTDKLAPSTVREPTQDEPSRC